MGRPVATFCSGKYSVFNNFCYTEFLAYFTLENESNKTCEYQPDELDDYLIENNQEEFIYLPKIYINDFKRSSAMWQSKMNPSLSCAR